MDYTISPFALADYDEVMALWQGIEGVGLDADTDSRDGVAAFLVRNPGLSFTARVDDRLVGAVLCGHDGRRGYLHHLAVAPDCRTAGIGRALVAACLGVLRVAGIPKCNIFVFQHNPEGQAFWLHIGWKGRVDLLVMQSMTGKEEGTNDDRQVRSAVGA